MGKQRRLLDEYRFADFDRNLKYRVYLGTRSLGLSGSRGSKKNDLRCCGAKHRSTTTRKCSGRGICPWGCSDIPGSRGAESPVQEVWDSETRETVLAGEQSLLHETICLPRGTEVSSHDHQGLAKELKLDWHTVKTLEKEYMQEQLRRNPVAAPRAIG